MGYSPGSVNESHYRVWYPTRWIRSMVLSRRNVFRMEIHWLALVDLWQAYVLQSISVSTPMTVHNLSRLREEHPLVSRRLTLCHSATSLRCRVALQSFKTSKHLCKAGLGSLAYFYFDFRDLDKQNRRNLLPSLLVQLSVQSSPRCDILHRLYLEHDNGTQKPTEAALTQCLKDMLTIPDQPPIYVILDALDECPNSYGVPSPRSQVLSLVKQLIDLRLPHLHVCVTSRPEFDIRATLGRLALHSVSLHDESGQKDDIIDYVKSVVYSDTEETMMKRWREEDKQMVVETLSEKADGM